MIKHLHDKHAIVTGAARGIGAAIAHALVAEALPGGPHAATTVDVADAASVHAAFARARVQQGLIAILVNNAGQADSAPFAKTSLELWQRMLAVNLTGSFLCAQAALPDMLEAGWGRIVNIAST